MPLSVGEKLGHYEVLSLLGQGGMGEVYKAHDARLRRDVAIKVSAARFNERFEREARAIAALNHPNICTLYDIGPDYLVMELVEGSSPKGPLALDEALRIAGQIAAALEAAHEKGIVHRDLKPANVKITPGGLVKVLDFGLAKMVREASPASPEGSTVTMGLTEAGTAMGTPAYMAPEQAQGGEVDKRADVWAFGVLLYELLTGQRAFKGDSVQATLAAVLTKEPPVDKLPARVRRLLRACLKKDPRERLAHIGDWRLLLDEDSPVQAAPARWSWVPWAVAIVGVALGGFGLYRYTSAGTGTSSLISFNVPIPGGGGAQAMFALSPDGQNLAIASPEKGQIHLWVRPLDGLEARLLPGAEGAIYPFWSPDGKQIGFFADGKLKRVSLAGGDPTVVTDVGVGVNGGTWGSQGVIVYAINNDLYRVEGTGGNSVPLAHAASGFFVDPEFLPDGRHFLYVNRGGGILVGSLDGGAPKQILPDLSKAVYADGNLLFRRQGRLVAQPFDAATLTASGAAVPVTKETVINIPSMGTTVLFSVAGSRVLAYQAQALDQLVWVDRTGKMKEKVGPPNEWDNFRLSPDENKIAMDISIFQGGNSGRDVALFDLVRGTQERLTSDPEADLVPIFSPRGDRILFTSRRMGRFNPFITSAPNQEKLVVDLGMLNGFPLDWSPDEKYILWWMDGDLWIVPASGSEKPYAYLHTRFDEHDGVFSPDGHWIAYASNESGRTEVYLEAFPADAAKRYTVSSQGGTGPAWRRDGKELFFVAGDGRLTAVPVTLNGADVQLGRAESLFPMSPGNLFHRAYEVSKDGQQFLIATPAQPGGAAITVVLNWQAALKK